MTRQVRLAAYVLAADPIYLAASVASYYSAVDRVVVSFDEAHVGWSGDPVPVTQCLRELSSIDTDKKIEFLPGAHSHPDRHPMDCETAQRQQALDSASRGRDWVLQLDGDEVIPDLDVFVRMVARAAALGHQGLDFPSRWIYGRASNGAWLELSTRMWGLAASYPGPLAVRAGTQLRHARQIEGSVYRVDFRARNTDPSRSRSTRVDATVAPDAGVLHFSWARQEADLRAKSLVSGHRDDFAWNPAIARWRWHLQHPHLAVLGTPLRRSKGLGSRSWLRSTRLSMDPQPLVLGAD